GNGSGGLARQRFVTPPSRASRLLGRNSVELWCGWRALADTFQVVTDWNLSSTIPNEKALRSRKHYAVADRDLTLRRAVSHGRSCRQASTRSPRTRPPSWMRTSALGFRAHW